MFSLPSGAADRPTSLSVRACRAQIVLDALLADPSAVVVAEDIASLPRFSRWQPAILDAAIGDLVDAGLISDDATGQLRVHPEPAA